MCIGTLAIGCSIAFITVRFRWMALHFWPFQNDETIESAFEIPSNFPTKKKKESKTTTNGNSVGGFCSKIDILIWLDHFSGSSYGTIETHTHTHEYWNQMNTQL